uniref:hypothetical protein n=1 Tax=Aminobacter niigataensis TaxID=83265 RepID=UPI0028524ED9|nr:hypothetical protein [Aminobacter niigataensis]WMD00117.1 hypothetical protein RAR13_28970 [Aminobacter niigataensis]
MAVYADHLTLAKALRGEMERALQADEWAIVVDAGFYTVFHGMEALNALECRDTYSFADAADIIETIVVERGLGNQFVSDYRYLFYFRRGALYGAHVPTKEQLSEFVARSRACVARIELGLTGYGLSDTIH